MPLNQLMVLSILAVCMSFSEAFAEVSKGEAGIPGPANSVVTGKEVKAVEPVQQISNEALYQCVDGTWKGPSAQPVTIDDQPGECPNGAKIIPHLLGAGVGYKLYSFSNVGTRKELDHELQKLGMSKRWIRKHAPSIFTTIKSNKAKGTFGLFALSEAGYSAYTTLQDTGYIASDLGNTAPDADYIAEPDMEWKEFQSFDDAEAYLLNQVELAKKLGPKDEAVSLYNLAEFYYTHGHYPEAKEPYKQALSIWEAIPPKDMLYVSTAQAHYAEAQQKVGHH